MHAHRHSPAPCKQARVAVRAPHMHGTYAALVLPGATVLSPQAVHTYIAHCVTGNPSHRQARHLPLHMHTTHRIPSVQPGK